MIDITRLIMEEKQTITIVELGSGDIIYYSGYSKSRTYTE